MVTFSYIFTSSFFYCLFAKIILQRDVHIADITQNRHNQRTIGYAKKIKKKKMFKSKHLVFAHFSTKKGDVFGIDGKIPIFCHKYFLK